MKYHERLGLEREPFSSSPDPEFLYYSKQHIACLQELEIAVRLKRGLNLVIGDIGTGKTTLCRRFVRNMSQNRNMAVNLLLDPGFASPRAFLRVLCAQFCGELPDSRLSVWSLKEMIKKALLRQGMREERTVVLIIDEGQKMPPECLEILRELLNYETNDAKLLQIIIFAQRELEPVVESMPNLLDRVNFYHRLKPLGFQEMREMVRYRVAQAAARDSFAPELFTWGAFLAIHRATGGYPRKVVRLCHKCLLQMLIAGKTRVTRGIVRGCLREERQLRPRRLAWFAGVAVSLLLVGSLAAIRWVPEVRSFVPALESALASVPGMGDSFASSSPEGGAWDEAPGQDVPDQTEAQGGGALEPFVPSAELPEVFGALHLARGESLSEAVRSVYGTFDRGLLDEVLRLNPHVSEPDRVPAAAMLRFPLVSPRDGMLPRQLYWVRLDSAASLEKAHARLRQYTFFDLRLRLLPEYTQVGGLRFQVVLERPSLEEDRARQLFETLPLALQKDADIYRPARETVSLGQVDSVVLETLAQSRDGEG